MYLNKVILMGNLTRDPELKALPSGIKVASISLATNRVWKDKDGVRQESTEYHNLVSFGRQAETLSQYCKKGSSIYIEGRMQTRSWDGQDGQKRYRTEVVIDSFQFGPKAGGAPSSGATPSRQSDAEAPQASAKPDLDTIEYPEEEINLEDIPF